MGRMGCPRDDDDVASEPIGLERRHVPLSVAWAGITPDRQREVGIEVTVERHFSAEGFSSDDPGRRSDRLLQCVAALTRPEIVVDQIRGYGAVWISPHFGEQAIDYVHAVCFTHQFAHLVLVPVGLGQRHALSVP